MYHHRYLEQLESVRVNNEVSAASPQTQTAIPPDNDSDSRESENEKVDCESDLRFKERDNDRMAVCGNEDLKERECDNMTGQEIRDGCTGEQVYELQTQIHNYQLRLRKMEEEVEKFCS